MPRTFVGFMRAASAAEVDWGWVEGRSFHFNEFVIGLVRVIGDVRAVFTIILPVADTMFVKTPLPDVTRPPDAGSKLMRKTALDALHAAFEGLSICWGEEQMEVIRHDHERMKRVALFVAIVKESFPQKRCGAL